jgi:hypothetical protein
MPFRASPAWRCDDLIAHSARFKSCRPDFLAVCGRKKRRADKRIKRLV